ERRGKPRHADREAGRRHRLAAEARDEAVIATAAADRAEAHGAAAFVLGLERQLHLVDRAGVVLEPADDGWVDADAVVPELSRSARIENVVQFCNALLRSRIAPEICV